MTLRELLARDPNVSPAFVRAIEADRISADLASDLMEVLSEAAVEILNNDEQLNPVYQRLRKMQKRIVGAERGWRA